MMETNFSKYHIWTENCWSWKQISPNITSEQKIVYHGNKSLQISNLDRKVFIMETNLSKYHIWTETCLSWKQISPNITSGQKIVYHGNKFLQILHLDRQLCHGNKFLQISHLNRSFALHRPWVFKTKKNKTLILSTLSFIWETQTDKHTHTHTPVSYTHLTLPTKLSV